MSRREKNKKLFKKIPFVGYFSLWNGDIIEVSVEKTPHPEYRGYDLKIIATLPDVVIGCSDQTDKNNHHYTYCCSDVLSDYVFETRQDLKNHVLERANCELEKAKAVYDRAKNHADNLKNKFSLI